MKIFAPFVGFLAITLALVVGSAPAQGIGSGGIGPVTPKGITGLTTGTLPVATSSTTLGDSALSQFFNIFAATKNIFLAPGGTFNTADLQLGAGLGQFNANDSEGNPEASLSNLALTLNPVVSPTKNLTASLAGSGSDNTNGTHLLIFIWTTSTSSCSNANPNTYTPLVNGASAASVNITTNQNIILSAIPQSTDNRVSGTCILETKSNTTTPYFFVTSTPVPAGMTDTTLSLADASFGAQLYEFFQGTAGNVVNSGVNTTACSNFTSAPSVIGNSCILATDEYGDTLNLSDQFTVFGPGAAFVQVGPNGGNQFGESRAVGVSLNDWPINAGPIMVGLPGTTGSIGGSLLTAACASGTVSITGAVPGETVTWSTSDGTDLGAAFNVRASVTSSGTVTVFVCTPTSGTPAAKTYNIVVHRQ
jgi:hypothetical protein